MTKQEKFLWTLFAGFLVILFLLSSTDLIIKEKKTEIYPVSIILDDTSDDYDVNFRKGVDKAAAEYNVDVSFITLYEKYNVQQQTGLVKREIDDGAGAIVLMPVDPIECTKQLDEMVLNGSVIIAGTMFPNEKVMGGVSPDRFEAGRKLGEAVREDYEAGTSVYLFTEGLRYGYNQEVCDGVRSVLGELYPVTLYEKATEDTFRQAVEEMVYPGGGASHAVVAALDPESLDTAADIISGSPVYGEHILGLYGVGSTTKLLNRLDDGIINGMVVYNQFDEGYLCVEMAVAAIKKGRGREQITLESYYIEKENLRESRFEKILYPVE